MAVTESGIVMPAKDSLPEKAETPLAVRDSWIVMIAKDPQFCKAPLPMASFTGTNFPERTGDVDLEGTLCMDCLFRCCFYFVPGVNDSHFRFGMQQPADSSVWSPLNDNRLATTCTLEIWHSIGSWPCFNSQALSLQFSTGGCRHDNQQWGHHLLRFSLSVCRALRPWRPWKSSKRNPRRLLYLLKMWGATFPTQCTLCDKFGGSVALRHNHSGRLKILPQDASGF